METQKRQTAADQALLPVTIGELAACVFGGVALGGFAEAYGSPCAQGLEATGHRLLADPLVIFMGAAAAVLMVGAGFLSDRFGPWFWCCQDLTKRAANVRSWR